MSDARVEDLLSLDRDVARASSAVARWRAGLAREPDQHADDDPLEALRHVAGQSTLAALRDLSPTAAEAPLRDALLPWVAALTMARVGREDDVAWAVAAGEPRGLYQGDPPERASWRQAWRGVVAGRTEGEAQLWLDAAGDFGEGLSSITRTRAERRMEVARRLGRAHPWELLDVAGAAALRAGALRLLDATEDLSRAVWKNAKGGPAEVLHDAVGREAGEGWPAHLAPRWLDELFGPALRGLRIDLAPLPNALGATSFARSLATLGFAVRVAAAPAAMPFALAREPGSRAAHRLGFVFGGLAANVVWQTRALGLARRSALRQARVLARAALLDARLHAARLLLGDDAAPLARDRFDDLGRRLFGVQARSALDPRLRGAWPPARDDEPARFVGLVESLAFARDLRDGFDVDWFRNPRAWTHLRAISAVPAREPRAPDDDAKALERGVDAVARAFEEALG
jgi:hypothetical protein